MNEIEKTDGVVQQSAGATADTAAVRAAPPSPDVAQQPGFKVLEKEPSRGGAKLVWTALVVVLAILAAYYFGLFR